MAFLDALKKIGTIVAPVVAGAAGGPLAAAGTSALLQLSDRLEGGGGGGKSTLDQIAAGERGAFEGAAEAFLAQTARGTAQAGQRLGQSFASRGINDSPLATSLAEQQAANRQQAAFEQIAQQRFGLESRIADREFRRRLAEEAAQSGLDTELIAAATEIGLTLFTDPEILAGLKEFFSDDELAELFPSSTGRSKNPRGNPALDELFTSSGFIPPNATTSDLERLLGR